MQCYGNNTQRGRHALWNAREGNLAREAYEANVFFFLSRKREALQGSSLWFELNDLTPRDGLNRSFRLAENPKVFRVKHAWNSPSQVKSSVYKFNCIVLPSLQAAEKSSDNSGEARASKCHFKVTFKRFLRVILIQRFRLQMWGKTTTHSTSLVLQVLPGPFPTCPRRCL